LECPLSLDGRDRPNVRSLNTLLRGCLWTAAKIHIAEDGAFTLTGGVSTSEEIWELSKRFGLIFDSTSYEYSIMMLCQSLRCTDAERRIEEMKEAMGVQKSGESLIVDDATVLESLAISMVSLARSHALLGDKDKAMKLAKKAVVVIESACTGEWNDSVQGNGATSHSKDTPSSLAIGGKRGWKESQKQDLVSSTRRSNSNMLFRSHRLSELKLEANAIGSLCDQPNQNLVAPHVMASYLLTRLLYFSGGGTTDLSALEGSTCPLESKRKFKDIETQLMNSLWLSFGLAAAVGRSSANSKPVGNSLSLLRKRDRALLREATVNQRKFILDDNGFLDYTEVFSPISLGSTVKLPGDSMPLHIELGSGSGDWIVLQARKNPLQNYISVELRADRVFQTFSKLILNSVSDCSSNLPLNNLCCVGSECGSFLRSRVKDGSVSTIYVNHPEPPTQTLGSDDKDVSSLLAGTEEPAHMLNSKTLIEAARCLKRDGEGKLIIVTDNRWYARLICFTLQKILVQNNELLSQMALNGKFHCIEKFSGEGKGYAVKNAKNAMNTTTIVLYEGMPNELIGHFTDSNETGGRSYFDRLWRTGAGSHSEMKKRFIIALRSYKVGEDKQTVEMVSGEQLVGKSSSFVGRGKGNEIKLNKKRSAEKQQRRNKRRLAKKAAAGQQTPGN